MIRDRIMRGSNILGWALVGLGLSGSIVGCVSVSDVTSGLSAIESIVSWVSSLQ